MKWILFLTCFMFFSTISELYSSTPYESFLQESSSNKGLNGLQLKTQTFLASYEKGVYRQVDPLSFLTLENFLSKISEDTQYVKNLNEIQHLKLNKSPLLDVGWKYYSFPLRKGGAAKRFRDDFFLKNRPWQELYDYYIQSPPETLISKGQINKLSALEKYELLIGDKNYTLSKNEWQKGLDYKLKYGQIPYWYGACHGTAPASIRDKEPLNEVEILAADEKTKITFTQKDLKVLLSYSWATNRSGDQLLGQRCNHVINDTMYSRVSSCFDINPGLLHIVTTNIIGKHKYPFIIDTSPGREVWNRPVVKYKYEYFHPLTKRYSTNLKNTVIDINSFTNDPFKYKRALNTKFITGVWLRLTVINDSTFTSSSSQKEYSTVDVLYDLELDSTYNILGGEWHSKQHPDFSWLISPETHPYSLNDRFYLREHELPTVNLRNLPGSLINSANNDIKNNKISYLIINYLNELSQKGL